ncbi:XRE family transcriptional regulator [Halomonas venusta]|uniref:LexA family protein n=1 Tax=Vreelandella venusta TaxID=44935 RepID=UPI00295E44D7|nr:XRE family transcriptional regulator [Halomonas venusta]MDW0357691.1 XRE family transcriptional regulator [Halomonas venusta]
MPNTERITDILDIGTPFCKHIGSPISFLDMTIGDRVKRARKHAGLNQRDLAKAIGITQPSLSELERGESRSSAYLIQIASACGVNASWLATGEGEMLPQPLQSLLKTTELSGFNASEPGRQSNVAPAPRLEGYVPIINWVQAGAWAEVCENFAPEEFAPRPPNSSEHTFALRVRGQSMLPKYEPDLIIYVDPEVAPFDGDDVVALLTEHNEATFKQLVEEPGGGRLLKARNPSWPEPWIHINGNCEIIGVVIGALWLRKPRV